MEKNKKRLLELMRDPDLQKLSMRSVGVNIFDILKVSRMEIRHSNVLSWLLDPNGSHELGDSFLYRFISKLSESLSLDTSLKLLSTDLYSFNIKREWKNIDILLVSEKTKTVIAIENKIGAHEHKSNSSDLSQLDVYQSTIQNVFSNKYDSVLIYLTPDGDIPSNENWTITTYYDILEILENLYDERGNSLKDEVNVIIKNYIMNLKDNVIMDQELVDLCNTIYQKHQKALDLIFENRDDIASRISSLIRTKYETNEEIELDKSKMSKSFIRFLTPALKKHFDGLEPWVNYFYQFQTRPKDDYLILELVFHKQKGDKLEEKYNKRIYKICDRASKKGEDWQWKRAWSSKIEDLSLKKDEELSTAIDNCIKEMKSLEETFND